jgi:aspartate carbamoyltransferase catalytic subunit
MSFTGPHLLGIDGLTKEQVLFILDTAEQFVEISERSVKKVPTLRGKTVVNLFLEPSTRTRTSFEIAAKRLSADAINMGGKDSSVSKGETLIDTALNIQAMAPDIVVMRHQACGAPHLIARHLKNVAVVNAGDGLHEHPTQALLDSLSIRQRLGRLENITLTMVGDVLRGRVARSNILLHRLFGNKVRVAAPPTVAVKEFKALGVEVFHNLDEALPGSDVVMTLRMKHEYQTDFYVPNLDEYARHFCLTERRIAKHCPDAIVLAPGPIIRGTEIESALADGPRSLISKQVSNGVAVRMAVLFLLCSRGKEVGELDHKSGLAQ